MTDLIDLVESVKNFNQVKAKNVYENLLYLQDYFSNARINKKTFLNLKSIQKHYFNCFELIVGKTNKEQFYTEIQYLEKSYNLLREFFKSKEFELYFKYQKNKGSIKQQSINLFFAFQELYLLIEKNYFYYNKLTLNDYVNNK